MIWRPVLKRLGTLKEVQYEWDLDDLADAHEVLDLKESAQSQAMQRPTVGPCQSGRRGR